jgi:hypothetical protein
MLAILCYTILQFIRIAFTALCFGVQVALRLVLVLDFAFLIFLLHFFKLLLVL